MDCIESKFAKMENGRRSLLMITFPVQRKEVHFFQEPMEMSYGYFYCRKLMLKYVAITILEEVGLLMKE